MSVLKSLNVKNERSNNLRLVPQNGTFCIKNKRHEKTNTLFNVVVVLFNRNDRRNDIGRIYRHSFICRMLVGFFIFRSCC